MFAALMPAALPWRRHASSLRPTRWPPCLAPSTRSRLAHISSRCHAQARAQHRRRRGLPRPGGCRPLRCCWHGNHWSDALKPGVHVLQEWPLGNLLHLPPAASPQRRASCWPSQSWAATPRSQVPCTLASSRLKAQMRRTSSRTWRSSARYRAAAVRAAGGGTCALRPKATRSNRQPARQPLAAVLACQVCSNQVWLSSLTKTTLQRCTPAGQVAGLPLRGGG